MPPAKRVKRSSGDALARRSSPRTPQALTTPFKPPTINSGKENQPVETDDTVEVAKDNEHEREYEHRTPDKSAYSNDEDTISPDPTTPARPSATTSTTTPTSKTTTSPSFFTPASKTHAGYNALKSHNGQTYTGMAVGGSHVWNYDSGTWRETKEEPDLWKIDFETVKRRAKNAPVGSGAPVGTEYHWLIVAHQYVTKTSANTYTTHLTGSKYKLAHKNAPASSTTSPRTTSSTSTSWSIPTVKGQRDREIELLEDAKRRVQGLPPVLASERVRGDGNRRERGQMRLDEVFGRGLKTEDKGGDDGGGSAKKRKRAGEEEEGIQVGEEVEF